MDWDAAIERNREALKRVLAALVAMAGLVNGQSAIASRQSGPAQADTDPTDCRLPSAGCRILLPRHLHRVILRLLRPAEAAVRRLVIVAARGLVAALPPVQARQEGRSSPRDAAGAPGLPLFDPLPLWRPRRRYQTGAVPRISVPGFTALFPIRRPPTPFDPVDAARLALRLAALASALDDLPRQARRFARWRAKRDAAGAQKQKDADAARTGNNAAAQAGKPRRFGRVWPLRPGRPPGHHQATSKQPPHEVHAILTDVHGLALWALEPADTS